MKKEISTFHSGRYTFNAELSEKTASLLNAVTTMYAIPLLPESRGKVHEKIEEKTVYNILKLQGSSVTFDQVCRIVKHDRNNFSQDVKSVETINTFYALKYIEEQHGKKLSHDIITAINNELADNMPLDEVGRQYRQGYIYTIDERYTPPASALDINFLLKRLAEWITSVETDNMHPLIKGIITHLHLVKIQPFKSFNQTTAMVTEIFVLKSLGMNCLPNLLPQIYAENKKQYDEAIKDFLTTSSICGFTEFVCTAIIEKLGRITSDNIGNIRKNTIKSHLDSLLAEKQLIKRQHGFLIMVHENNLEFAAEDLQLKKPFTKFYADVSRTTTSRDIKKFHEMNLIREKDGRYCFNENILSY